MDTYTLLVLTAAIGAGSIVKGATGVGLPLIAVPFMTTLIGLHHAIAIMIVPVLASNIWQLVEFRGHRSDPRLSFLVPMIATAILGVIGGTFFLSIAPERLLTLCLGVVLLAYLGFRILRPNAVIETGASRRFAAPVGLLAGLLHGATGVSAPISVPFIHAMRLGRPAHVFAISAIFLALAVIQWPTLYLTGVLQPAWLLDSAIALVPMFVFIPVGQFLGARLSGVAFDRLILAFLGIMGAKLLLGL